MNNVTRITKEELVAVIAENFKQNKDLLLNINNVDNSIICKQVKVIEGHQVEFYYDRTSYVNIEAIGSLWNKLFNKRHIIIAINTICDRLQVESGNMAMINVKANWLKQEGQETVIVDSKIDVGLFKGKSKVIFSKLKGNTIISDSDVFATMSQTKTATFAASEIKMCRFVTDKVSYINEIVHDTTVDTERTQLMKSLMSMKKSFESI